MRSDSFTGAGDLVAVPCDQRVAPGVLQVRGHHLAHQLGEADPRRPTELSACLARIPEQRVNLGRPEVARVDSHDDPSAAGIDAMFIETLALPADLLSELACCELDEFAHGVLRAAGDDEVIGL